MKIKLLQLINAQRNHVTKNCRETTYALEPQKTVRDKFSEIKPLIPSNARQSRATKNIIAINSASSLEPQNTVKARPGREIKPLVLAHARQSKVTKYWP